jgi:uncharacterized protein DUF3352
MRRVPRPRLVLAAAVAALALLPGCGSDKSSKAPLDDALSYMPANSPFVVSISTDLQSDQYKSLEALARKFPFAGQAITQLKNSLESSGNVSYKNDVKPLLGNEAVVSGADVQSFVNRGTSGSDFFAALKTKDKGKLEDLVKKDKGESKGDYKGAKLYQSGDTAYALDGDLVVLTETQDMLKQALDRHDSGSGMTKEKFDKAFDGLPADGLFRAYFDVQGLVNGDPDTVKARKVKWVRALRSFGAVASADRQGLSFDFRLVTDPAGLADSDLPLPPGGGSAQLPARPAGSGTVAVGLRDFGHAIDFCSGVAKALGEHQSCDLATQLEKELGPQLAGDVRKNVFDQLKGDVVALIGLDKSYGVATKVADQARLEKTLAELSKEGALGGGDTSAGGRPSLTKSKGGLYTLITKNGDRSEIGVVDGKFVVADSPASAATIASAGTEAPSGSGGSLVASLNAEDAANAIIKRSSSGGLGALGGALFTKPLGDFTLSASNDTSSLRGKARLGID